jgi:hypothetical protein
MCTLSFIPTKDGCTIGMNRDELRTRARSLYPRIYERGQILAAYPSEPEGGTWFAVNGRGTLLALLNWNITDPHTAMPKQKSRGELIPELIFQGVLSAAETALHRRSLGGLLPFRLVGIDPLEEMVREWCWNGESVETIGFPWNRRHWFSSSLSDSAAEEQRGVTCAAAYASAKADDPDWLLGLNRSHRPTSGAYSLCVHRPDAATVSYTEVVCVSHHISMRYIDGSPCEATGFHHTLEMPRTFKLPRYSRTAAATF